MTFDPVAEPDAYRRSLLAALGEQDPVVVLDGGPATARRLVVEAGANLRTRPAAAEWSVLECLAHLTDAELVTGGRLRWIAAEDQPDIVGYDQDLWVDRLHQVEEDPESLLGAYAGMRRWNLDLWARVPAPDRDRFGVHRERGRESFDLTFRLLAGHDLVHLAQARRALEVVGDGARMG